MKKYRAIVKNANGETVRTLDHDTQSGAEKYCEMQKLYNRIEFENGWTTAIEEFDFEFEKPEGYDDFLAKVKAEVERIGRGYTCNFQHRGYNEHHINGYNHFCFSLEGDKVHPMTVGGSRVAYVSDFTKSEFIDKLEEILIPSPCDCQDMTDITPEEKENINPTNKKDMTTEEQITSTFSQYNDDANSRWEDEKILELCNYKETGDTTELTVSIGKHDTTFHDLVVDTEGITIKQQSANNPLIEDVIHYILNPIFFGN
jgi:hypothetical protein